MNRKEVIAVVQNLAAQTILAWAAVDAFGWLHGLGITCAIWLLTPYRYETRR